MNGSYALATINNNNLYDNNGGYDLYSGAISEVDARFNYWGLTTTAIMGIGGNPKDIPRIYDFFDDSSRGVVNYSGWLDADLPELPHRHHHHAGLWLSLGRMEQGGRGSGLQDQVWNGERCPRRRHRRRGHGQLPGNRADKRNYILHGLELL